MELKPLKSVPVFSFEGKKLFEISISAPASLVAKRAGWPVQYGQIGGVWGWKPAGG